MSADAASFAQYATALSLLIVSISVIFFGWRMGLSRARQELIDTLSVEMKLLRDQLNETRSDLALAQASLAKYRGQIQLLLEFIQKSDVAGAAAVNAIARQMREEDDFAQGRRPRNGVKS